jgi:hypothetical protein
MMRKKHPIIPESELEKAISEELDPTKKRIKDLRELSINVRERAKEKRNENTTRNDL